MTETNPDKPRKPLADSVLDWAVIGLLVSWGVLGLTATWTVAANWAGTSYTIEYHDERLDDHETRLRGLERQLDTISGDVRWIRRAIENGGY
jgi:hypothetical protein